MKKTTLFIICLVIAGMNFNLYAQINMTSDGHVGIGSLAFPNYTLTIKETTSIQSRLDIMGTSSCQPPLFVNGGAFLTATGNYNVGIGAVPIPSSVLKVGGESSGPTLYVAGSYYATEGWYSSDKRLKKNIKTIDNASNKLKNLSGKTYSFKTQDEFNHPNKSVSKADTIYKYDENGIKTIDKILSKNNFDYLPEGETYGLIAQEVLEIVPELVMYDTNSGTYGINYNGFIPILIEGFKELSSQVEELKAQVEYLSQTGQNNKDWKKSVISKMAQHGELSVGMNIPNPFTNETTINYYIPSEASTAMLMVYNLQGKQVLQHSISQRELGSITISSKNLDAGIYLYAIMADGVVSDTRQMILTK